MTYKFTQNTFFFGEEEKKIPIVQSVSSSSKFIPTTLQTGLNQTVLKNTSVLLLRGLLSQNLRRSLTSDSSSQKARQKFMQALIQEIKLKKSGADPVYLLRKCLIQL